MCHLTKCSLFALIIVFFACVEIAFADVSATHNTTQTEHVNIATSTH